MSETQLLIWLRDEVLSGHWNSHGGQYHCDACNAYQKVDDHLRGIEQPPADLQDIAREIADKTTIVHPGTAPLSEILKSGREEIYKAALMVLGQHQPIKGKKED